MDLPTPSDIDTRFSRARLKDIAAWSRDDLDKLVARRGPDSLKPDDVLTLHDIFVAFRKSTTIRASDLRASGIHKAITVISDGTNRWPTRLCIECDKVISAWTAKFGEFNEIRPVLHGRGGRLEGIANATEFSRQALLGRWTRFSPDAIADKTSHRRGDLGFKAGAWWINSLFAHHAGIIGKESIDGGTTFDDHGAYAVVIKEENEVSTRPDGSLRYLTSMSDKGRFRLTAATPKSREPIRVLRSCNDHGIWGPRAGIRFDGLYVVRGWSIRMAKDNEAVSGHLKPAGGISYEIVLQRNDEVPLEEVIKRPTNADLDDYMEYDRLRQKHDGLKRHIVAPTVKFAPHPVKDTPPIRPIPVTHPSSDSSTTSIIRAAVGPSTSSMTINQPAFSYRPRKKSGEAEVFSNISPRTPLVRDDYPFNASDSSDAESPQSDLHNQIQSINNLLTNTNALKEIIPWIDQDPDLESLPPSVDSSNNSGNGGELDMASIMQSRPLPNKAEADSSSHASSYARQEIVKREWSRVKTIGRHDRSGSHKNARSPRDTHAPQDPSPGSLNPGLPRSVSSGQYSRFFSAHDPRAIVSSHGLISARSISSMRSDQSNRSKTKTLHGGGDSTNDCDDYLSLLTHDARVSGHSRPSTPKRSHEIPMNSSSGFVRTSVPASCVATSTHVPGKSPELYRTSTPGEPLMNFITRARPASPVGSPASTSVIWRGKESRNSESVGSELHMRDDREGVYRNNPIVFSDPFTKDKVQRVLRRWSSGVAPDVVG